MSPRSSTQALPMLIKFTGSSREEIGLKKCGRPIESIVIQCEQKVTIVLTSTVDMDWLE